MSVAYTMIIETPSGPHYYQMRRGTRETRRNLFKQLRADMKSGGVFKVRIFRFRQARTA